MGHIGGKFSSQLFPLLPLRHVHGQHHRACDLAGFQHRACDYGKGSLPLLHQLLAPPAGQRLLRRLPEPPLRAASDVIRSRRQEHRRAVVLRQHTPLLVDEQESLAHVLRHGGKLPHTAAQLVHLPAYGVLLLPQALGQGLQLRVHVLGVIRGDGVDGLRDLPGQPHRQGRRQNEQHRHRGRNGPGHIQQHGPQTALLPAQAQHRAVLEPQSVV